MSDEPKQPANPLADLCRRMGLSVSAVTKLTGLPERMVETALAPEPKGAVEAYVKIVQSLDGKIRVPVTPTPMVVRVPWAAVDALHYSARFRAICELEPVPVTKVDLRAYVRQLRRNRGLGYNRIMKWMTHHHIPTAGGKPVWNKSAVTHLLNRREAPNAHERIVPTPEFWQDWRETVSQRILAELCGPDASALFRYKMDVQETESHYSIHAPKGLPICVRRWLVDGVRGMDFLYGHWEVIDGEPPP